MNDSAPAALSFERGASSQLRWTSVAGCSIGLLLGIVITLGSMSARPHLPYGFGIGLFGTLLAIASVLSWTNLAEVAAPAREVNVRAIRWPLAQACLALALTWGALRLGVMGVLPRPALTLAVTVTALLLWLLVALAITAGRLGFLSEPGRPLLRRHGFWLLVITLLLYVPRLGSFGLIDPWETHYGEVAREMLSRDDWISLWWAQDGWFWSKPILNFWLQGLSFSVFGVAWEPDQMIQAVAIGRTPMPEWAARLPVFALAVLGQHLLYAGARRYVGRLAAFLGALVLATSPYWYLLARQSVADMVYVGPLCAAMGAALLALDEHPDARVGSVALRLGGSSAPRLLLSGKHLLLFALLLVAVPELVYLLSRNVTLHWSELPLRFALHLDRIPSGSPGNCGLPGNSACREDTVLGWGRQPGVWVAGWALCTLLLVWLRRRETRAKRLYFLAAGFFAGLSFMGKGAPGLVLAAFTLLGFLVCRRRLGELRHADVFGVSLCMAAIVMPWFVQEYLRHGSDFFERLFIHDMYKRAFDHVHDTNKGDDTSFRYYVWQLGYGLFPWSGLAAAGTLWSLGRASQPSEGEPAEAGPWGRGLVDLTYFCWIWQLGAFGMFAITGTKFHHYILPLVPAAALLTGVFVAAAARRNDGSKAGLSPASGALALGAAAVVGLVGRDLMVSRPGGVEGSARLLHLITYNYSRSWPDKLDYFIVFAGFTGLSALVCLLMAWPRLRRWAALGSAAVGVAASAWAINVYVVKLSPHFGQRETISEYYKRRTGPEEPLIAYQLNWKGENFYTGNNVPAFVSSGKRFTDWVAAQRKKGVEVMFFTTEHSRTKNLERELGKVQRFELLTDAALNDKFVLARAVL